MLRAGVTEAPPPEEDDHPLFSAASQKRLAAIEGSDAWRFLRDGIHAQREALLSTPLRPDEAMRERWGAIQQLSLLLHGGPQLILQYAQLEEKTEEPVKESSYVAKAAMFEG
jgi:hypothetical protein